MNNFANGYVKYTNRLEQINKAAKDDPCNLVEQIEKAFRQSIEDIAQRIICAGHYKVIMLSGPSSSSKTTTAEILTGFLKQLGMDSVTISLDDFYRGAGKAPRLPNGQYDYESIEALDVGQIETCLLNLMEHSACDMPVFNFHTKEPFPHKRHVELLSNQVAIVEGIHALNPAVTNHLPEDRLLKMYISVKQGIKDTTAEVLSPQDIRLVRRIVRDYNFRGTMPDVTLDMWQHVCEGEERYIKPFKHTSDITINSIHIYEPCVLQNTAVPLLKMIGEDNPFYDDACRLIESLSLFCPIPERMVPKNSVLREFIGGGNY